LLSINIIPHYFLAVKLFWELFIYLYL